LNKLLLQASIGQLQVNAEEAKHASLFVSGWRPFVGWVCGGGFVYSFIGQPLFTWVSAMFDGPVAPLVDTGTLLTLLLGMLGLGGMRTYEKTKEVARDAITPISTKVTQYRD
jgi:hypothetical protein